MLIHVLLPLPVMRNRAALLVALIVFAFDFCGTQLLAAEDAVIGAKPKTTARTFDFHYGATVNNVPQGSNVRIWVPIASSNDYQNVELQHVESQSSMAINQDAEFGNSIGFFESTAAADGSVSLLLQYRATREEVKFFDDSTATRLSKQASSVSPRRFLSANKRVPTNGKPLELLAGVELPGESVEAGRALYGLVEKHMSYDKSKPGWGKGDSVWACDSRTGNCTDFHSLFISLARSRKLPARFEIGFPLPTDVKSGEIKGYHCWAWMFVDGRDWLPVDISEADKHPELRDYYFGNLTPDRLAFSSGRDIKLVPESVAEPLNFFVYPHVEVDGKVWERDNIELDFSFADVD